MLPAHPSSHTPFPLSCTGAQEQHEETAAELCSGPPASLSVNSCTWQADLRCAAWRGSAQNAIDLAGSPACPSVQADGAFEISDLPSASYILEVCAYVVAAPMS